MASTAKLERRVEREKERQMRWTGEALPRSWTSTGLIHESKSNLRFPSRKLWIFFQSLTESIVYVIVVLDWFLVPDGSQKIISPRWEQIKCESELQHLKVYSFLFIAFCLASKIHVPRYFS